MVDQLTSPAYPLYFIALQGDVVPPIQTLENISRPACDGQAWRYIGIKGEPFRLTGIVDVVSLSDANGLLSFYQTFPGQLCTITIRGYNYLNYMCLDFRITSRHVCANGIGGINGGSILVTSEWMFQYGGA